MTSNHQPPVSDVMIDLRSDADTLPTNAMREAMASAVVGDDILGEDPTTNELQAYAADLFGKEAALLTISGTMSNQIAIMSLTDRGDEVVAGTDAHLFNLEVAATATLSQVQIRPVTAPAGCFDVDELRESIRAANIQQARTSLICTESTYNLNAGFVPPLSNLAAIHELAAEHGIQVYLDGARLFNAAAALQLPLRELAATADVLQVCLTKGLGCPLGSLLLGPSALIQRAKRMRQRIGGGMRQSGIIAAAGLVGLKHMRERIGEDNARARLLASNLAGMAGLRILETPQSNIVSIEVMEDHGSAMRFAQALMERGILIKAIGKNRFRMVTHYQIGDADIAKVTASIREALAPASR